MSVDEPKLHGYRASYDDLEFLTWDEDWQKKEGIQDAENVQVLDCDEDRARRME